MNFFPEEEVNRYDDKEKLLMELEQHRDKIENEITELEKIVFQLKDYAKQVIQQVGVSREQEECEWKTRYEVQKEYNLHLMDGNEDLNSELAEINRNLETETYPQVMSHRIRELKDEENVVLVKQLEKLKKDFEKIVVDTDNKMEKETKKLKKYEGLRTHYKKELRFLSNYAQVTMEEEMKENPTASEHTSRATSPESDDTGTQQELQNLSPLGSPQNKESRSPERNIPSESKHSVDNETPN